jgi:alpha-ketoglutaric semialdehyde dehydrogenase
MYNDFTAVEIDAVMQKASEAFNEFSKLSLSSRANFMRAIAVEIESLGPALIETAMEETNLPEARLLNERARTIFQLNSYADACLTGRYLEARIDTAMPERTPPRPDIRKMMIPLGPVVVFGSSNFPFAFSTAGGDTASAFAAGCTVIVKAHPAHVRTSAMMAGAIEAAVKKCDLPEGVFSHVIGASFEVGKALVTHPYTKAVGFTGSYNGGKQLFDWGNQRKEPIPVFAEMGSTNPVFLLPEKLSNETAQIAKMFAGSITMGGGQFCTKPGILIGIDGPGLKEFAEVLKGELDSIAAGKMLHAGIATAYNNKRGIAVAQPQVSLLTQSVELLDENCGLPTIAMTDASNFLTNELLRQEVFGPYALIVACKDASEMIEVAGRLDGQLTATVMATDADLKVNRMLLNSIERFCGRIIFNGVPTGVEVCLGMQHGGPFPATSDARFTSVGADAIKRFLRPISFQNCSNEMLPDALKNENPLKIIRTVNNETTLMEIIS